MTPPDNPVSSAEDAEFEHADDTTTEQSAMARSTLRALQAGRSRGAGHADGAAATEAVEDDTPETVGDVDTVGDAETVGDADTVGGVDTAPDGSAEPSVEPDAAPDAAPTTGSGVEPERRARKAAPDARHRSGFPLVAITALVTAAALVFAVVAGVVWYNAGHNSSRSKAIARDAATLQARLDIEAVNTADYRNAARAVDSWLSVSTGKLHSEYQSARTSTIKLLTQAKVATTASVLDAAVVTLNEAKGTATIIASTNVTKRPATGAAVTARNRFKATMHRVDGTWKLADLGLVPVALS